MDFGGNAGLFLPVVLCFICGLQFGLCLVFGRIEKGINDGFGIVD